jgi:hypothetical protein
VCQSRPLFDIGGGLTCFEPLDKVFGMLGLADMDRYDHITDALRESLQPDSTKPVTSVYRDAVRYSVVEHKCTELLRGVRHRVDGDLEGEGFASWVVRLDRNFDSVINPNPFPSGKLTITKAREFVQANVAPAEGDSDILKLPGLMIEVVTSCSSTLVYSEDELKVGPFNPETIQRWILACLAIIQDAKAENSVRNLSRTLTANRTYEGLVRPDDAVLDEGFSSYCQHYLHGNEKLLAQRNLDNPARSDPLRQGAEFRGLLGIVS